MKKIRMKKHFYFFAFFVASIIACLTISFYVIKERTEFPDLFHDIYANHPVVSVEGQQDTIIYVGFTPSFVHYFMEQTEDIHYQPKLTPSGHWLYQMTFADHFIAEDNRILNIETHPDNIVLQIYTNCILYRGHCYSISLETYIDDLSILFEQDLQQCQNTSMMVRLP